MDDNVVDMAGRPALQSNPDQPQARQPKKPCGCTKARNKLMTYSAVAFLAGYLLAGGAR